MAQGTGVPLPEEYSGIGGRHAILAPITASPAARPKREGTRQTSSDVTPRLHSFDGIEHQTPTKYHRRFYLTAVSSDAGRDKVMPSPVPQAAAAGMYCQKCRTPIRLDDSLDNLNPASFKILVGECLSNEGTRSLELTLSRFCPAAYASFAAATHHIRHSTAEGTLPGRLQGCCSSNTQAQHPSAD